MSICTQYISRMLTDYVITIGLKVKHAKTIVTYQSGLPMAKSLICFVALLHLHNSPSEKPVSRPVQLLI